MRLDENAFTTSRIGVRRSDGVHSPNVRPEPQGKALCESQGGCEGNEPASAP